jgi:ATP-dependent RNA helicase DHX29
MGKSKKKKRNDVRGYGAGKGPKIPASQSAASSKDMVVTKQTHEGIQSLVDRLKSSQIDPVFQNSSVGTSKNENSAPPAPPTANSTIRFVPKLTKIVDRLIDLGFRYDAENDESVADKKNNNCHLEAMVVALGYGITLESALDWLCLNVPTLELPPLFTDGNLRNNLMEEARQGGGNTRNGSEGTDRSSLTVLKFVSSSSSTSQSQSMSPIKGKNTNQEEVAKTKELERQQQQERMQKIREDKKIANEKAEAEAREAAKRRLLEQYAHYHDDSDSDEGVVGDDSNRAGSTETPLSPRETELLTKENELKELEADLACEANNYMRSKQEMKLMRNQVKKLKQQASGLRRKVENEKREREREQREKEDTLKKETEEEENGGDFFGGGGFFDNADEDEEEEEENVEETTETNADSAADANRKPLLDCPIPSGWTGTTPLKILEDTCRKQRLGKPTFLNLGRGPSGGYKLSGINVQKGKKNKGGKSAGGTDASTKDEWIALSSDFGSGSSLPDYLALKALYEIDSNKPLYGMFPPAFRSLWLSWMEEVQQQNDEIKQTLETKKIARIQNLLGIIEANHWVEAITTNTVNNDVDISQSATSSSRETNGTNKEGEHNSPAVKESWDDMEDDEVEFTKSETKNASKAGEGLKREFLQRQSTQIYAEMLRQRKSLPMTSYRGEVLDTIKNHQVMILCAETVSMSRSFVHQVL